MSLSRQVLLILATLAIALAISCTQQQQPAPPAPKPKPSPATGGITPSGPIIVSVEGKKAVPFPDPAYGHARAGQHNGQPVPSAINWFGPPDGELHVEMTDMRCLRGQPECKDDHCVGITNVKPGAKPGEQFSCKYSVWVVTGGVSTEKNDPIVIVDNCCDNLY